MVSRRNVIVSATAGVAALVAAGAAGAARGKDADAAPPAAAPATGHPGHTGHAVPVAARAVAPFSVRMPVPKVLKPQSTKGDTDVYAITAKKAKVEILPGTRTEVLTYAGMFPGPTLRVRTGRTAVVKHTNDLGMGTVAHLHGGVTPAGSDGFPMDTVAPGKSREYTYPNQQRAATLWYHDHAHHMEAEHVYGGLAGFYLIDDPAQDSLRLPSGDYDIPIMLRDARFDEKGRLVFQLHDFEHRNTILANGKPQPYFPVAARRYRLRFVNASNLRTFTLRLGKDTQVAQIASDGGLLAAPAAVRSWRMTPGERIEVVVDFSRFKVGSKVVLTDAEAGPVMRFDVGRSATPDTSRVPDRLSTIPALPAATGKRKIVLSFDPVRNRFLINGKQFDQKRVDAEIKRGTTEIWTLTNDAGNFAVPHNFHPHLVQFRVLDRNGRPPAPAEAGVKDTVAVGPGETVRLQATFGPYTGRYAYHCHMIDHSSSGMMAQMKIV
ncbi:Multicopper oxidase with three cupredoxin domains (includes cell division protein FtsP and spore coat protein CotA) [Asanoa hainanensis]|uniref:Multicopper oxidase CueO n=2 Tax=Asanoa hainanensis TaxID=560556 RepID=A0A239N621_9ACTN|nr:Multicopper oxidase with three cupredoxin domains (includes cell division protein FtsP and spore coat protein CotA) [Asanoa hainanensis]